MKKHLLWSGLLLLAGAVGAADLLDRVGPADLVPEIGTPKLIRVDGKPALELTGTTAAKKGRGSNLYLNFSVRFNPPVSLQGKTLRVQAAGTPEFPGFYVRAYNAGEPKKPVWSFLSWQTPVGEDPETFSLTAGRNRRLEWEKGMVSGAAADRVDRIQFFIGTPQASEKVRLVISGLEVVPELSLKDDPPLTSGGSLRELTRVTALRRETPLVADGRARFEILHPDSAAGREAAAKIAAAVRETTGATVTARPGTAKDRVPEQTTVMLGNIFNNPALMTLYTRQLTLADEFLPGKGGYTVESVIEPFRTGADVIVLGASDDAGLAPAADALIGHIRANGRAGSLTLPLTFDTRYTAKLGKTEFNPDTHLQKGLTDAQNILKNGTHGSLGALLRGIGDRYRIYRNPLDAKLYVEVARVYAESAKSDPRKFGGPWGFDSDFSSFEAISGWDLIEHDPVLTDEDRLATTNTILRWLREAIAAEAMAGVRGKGPVHNHLTFASLGTMYGSFYFGKYYGAELKEPAVWRRGILRNFARQVNAGKAYDDCDGYVWLTWRHVLVYAMAMPDDTVFENGVGAKALKLMGTTMDNLGEQAPYGDSSNWNSANSCQIVLDMYYAATRDPLAAYLLQLKRKGRGPRHTRNFYGAVRPETVPTVLDGFQVLPLDPDYYRFVRCDGRKPALERCFDKFSFREKLDPAALYVLVDGINNGGHRHADANSVLRYSQFGRDWLAENEYIKNQQKYHNSMLLLYNGESFPLPDYMEKTGSGDNADLAWISVRAAEVGPTDWIRHYVWLKPDRAWLVVDEVVAAKPGSYRLKQRWNGVGERTEKSDGYELAQKGSTVRLQTSADAVLTTYDDADLGRQWMSYPHAKPVIRVMDQTIERELRPGERVRMIAVWHGAADGAAVPEWSVRRDGDGFAIHTGSRRYNLAFNRDGAVAPQVTADAAPARAQSRSSSAAGAVLAPELETVWKQRQARGGMTWLTDPALAGGIRYQLSGSKPAAGNAFFTSSPNKLEAVADGSWSDGGDSVMFDPDQEATVDFAFEKQHEIEQVDLQLWWASTSSKGTAYKLKRAEVLLSNDHFRKDIRSVASVDAATDSHPNFGKPVPFRMRFPAQAARQVRVKLTPQDGTAIYLAEIALSGKPAADSDLKASAAEFTRICRVDDPAGAYLAAGSASGELFLYDLDGKLLKVLSFPARIHDVTALDLEGDGRPELLLACQDGKLRAIRRDGTPVWETPFDFYRLFPEVTIVKTADLDGDGKPEILVGCDNWRTYALDRSGKELWRFEVVHPTRAVEVFDLDGDGKPEILCGTRYYGATMLDHQGNKLWGGTFGFGCRALTAPRNGRGAERNVLIGIDNGKVTAYDRKGEAIREFHTGDEIFMMAVAAPNADGSEDAFAASFNGNVYRFRADGSRVWHRALPDSVVVLAPLPDGGVAAGAIDGTVAVLDAAGRIVRQAKFDGRIAQLLPDGKLLRVITRQGEVAALKL